MTTYRSTTVEVEAMQWCGCNLPGCAAERAEEIVAWVEANGGEARYEPNHPWSEFGTPCVCNDGDVLTRTSTPHPARIMLGTAGGMRAVSPGQYVVCQDHAWSVCNPEWFKRRWVTA